MVSEVVHNCALAANAHDAKDAAQSQCILLDVVVCVCCGLDASQTVLLTEQRRDWSPIWT